MQQQKIKAIIASNIRTRRKIAGLSQADLGTCLGVNFQQISKIELAKDHVTASQLWDIAKALQCSVACLYEGLNDGDESLIMDSDCLSMISSYQKLGPKTKAVVRSMLEEVLQHKPTNNFMEGRL